MTPTDQDPIAALGGEAHARRVIQRSRESQTISTQQHYALCDLADRGIEALSAKPPADEAIEAWEREFADYVEQVTNHKVGQLGTVVRQHAVALMRAANPADADAMRRERDEMHAYIESKHNGYGETGRSNDWPRPATHMDALRDLIEEGESLAKHEVEALGCEIAGLKARLASAENRGDQWQDIATKAAAQHPAGDDAKLRELREWVAADQSESYFKAIVLAKIDELIAKPPAPEPPKAHGSDVRPESVPPMRSYVCKAIAGQCVSVASATDASCTACGWSVEYPKPPAPEPVAGPAVDAENDLLLEFSNRKITSVFDHDRALAILCRSELARRSSKP